MNKNRKKTGSMKLRFAAATMAVALAAAPVTAFAADANTAGFTGGPGGEMPAGPGGQMPGGFDNGGMNGGAAQNVTYASSPSEIVTSTVENTAKSLTADTANATTITMSSENSDVKISEAGTYIVTGSCSDGNITVKKGTTGVVLILKDLDLTSTTGAAVSLNKNTQVKLVIEGTVSLTDNENPDDENSTDADVADAYDGAAIKAKDGSNVYLTGTGTLTVKGNAKNGIKIGDADTPSFVIDGPTVNITAANDGINSGYDLTILSGTISVSAADDGIHADRILTIGSSTTSPKVTVSKSNEAIEGSVVNIFGGTVNVTASDDGINAANKEGTYASEMSYSVNITGGTTTVSAGADGIDSNGDVNITGGKVTIKKSAGTAVDCGIDFDGQIYVYDTSAVNNSFGISGPDSGPGGMMPGNDANRPDPNTTDQKQTEDTSANETETQTTEASQQETSTDTTDTGSGTTADTSVKKTKKTVKKKYCTLVKYYENGKLTKVIVKSRNGSKISVKKDGKTYGKKTLTASGTYKITAKKTVKGKTKKQTVTVKIS